jgi:hypothetical protein
MQLRSALAPALLAVLAAPPATQAQGPVPPPQAPLAPRLVGAPAPAVVFDDRRLHELALTFEQPDFWDRLYDNYYAGNGEYLAATLHYRGRDYENVGVRFKGESSMWGFPTEKKPFKIKLDAFVPGQNLFGITKLSLSNGFRDPTMLREKLFYDAVGTLLPASRASFAKLYINGDYWGLYLNVEQVDKRFLQQEFGQSEDGNLFKGDPQGWLVWEGPEQANYYDKYELKTNESANDWSDLVDLIDRVDNSAPEDFPQAVEEAFEIHAFLFLSAFYNLYITLDSYIGEGHNFYLYHRDDSDRFRMIPWDANEAFAACPAYAWPELIELPLFWQRPVEESPRPLVNQAFEVPEYRQLYLMDYQYLLDHEFDPVVLGARIDTLAALIRPAVYADTQKMYSDWEFETNLEEDLYIGDELFYGLKSFIAARRASVLEQLAAEEIPARVQGVVINEFMAGNDTTVADEWGEYEDWIELYNSSAQTVDLGGLFLSDAVDRATKWELPAVQLAAHGHLLIWADKDPQQGPLHADFKLDAGGEMIGLYSRDGVIALDHLTFGPQESDRSYGRCPDGSDTWGVLDAASPGGSNCSGGRGGAPQM